MLPSWTRWGAVALFVVNVGVLEARGLSVDAEAEPACSGSRGAAGSDLFSATWLGTVGQGDDAAKKLAVSWRGEGEVDVALFDDADGDGQQGALERVLLSRKLGAGVEVVAVPLSGVGGNLALSWAGTHGDLHGMAGGSGACDFEQGFGSDGADNDVFSLAVFDDGGGPALYAGGEFTVMGGVSANGIAKWDGTNWSSLGSGSANGVDNAALVLAVFDDGGGSALYVGGSFTMAGGSSANGIAKWDGSTWSALDGGSGNGVSGTVDALAVFDDGLGGGDALYVGGVYTDAGGSGSGPDLIAKWDGSSWSALGTGVNNAVFALAVFDDGGGDALYAGGFFGTAGGNTVNSIAKWDGTTWSALGSGTGSDVRSLVVFDDGGGDALYVGGGFTTAGGTPANRIAKWDGTTWSALGSGMDGTVRSLTVFDDGSRGGPALYAGGLFTDAGGNAANRVAKWDGSNWSALGSGSGNGVGPFVNSLAVYDDGGVGGPALYAGGAFLTAGEDGANRIARWDGSSWSSFGSGNGVNNTVNALAVYDDGGGPALYAGGSFTAAGGVIANRIARWDGSGWSPLLDDSENGVSGIVNALGVFDDGSGDGPALYAGGSFTEAGGTVVNRIAKWDGTTWSALDGVMSAGVNTTVRSLVVYDDEGGGTECEDKCEKKGEKECEDEDEGEGGPALYAGGDFTTAGGTVVNRVAKWDGTTWSALVGCTGTGVDNDVRALAVFDDGGGPALYAGGEFDEAGEVVANGVAKWDGGDWSSLGIDSENGVNGPVFALTVFDDGGGGGPALYAGGDFTDAGTTFVSRVAKWDGMSWSSLDSGSGPGVDDDVLSLVVYDGGAGPELYAGGMFTTAGGSSANGIAKWDGSGWSAVGSGASNGVGGTVHSLAIFDGGVSLFVGGDFLMAGDFVSINLTEYRCPDVRVFSDGFESGDTMGWSATVP